MGVFARLMAGFGALTGLCVLVGGIGWTSLDAVQEKLDELTEVRLPAVESLGTIQEGLSSLRTAERALLISRLAHSERNEITAAMEPMEAMLERGMDQYAPLPRTAQEEQAWRDFTEALELWKEDHIQVVKLVGIVFDDNVDSVQGILLGRQLEHVKWVKGLSGAIENRKAFSGQLNPGLCRLGRWLADYQTENKDLAETLAEFETPHRYLHDQGEEINVLIDAGDDVSARRLFDDQVLPTLAQIEEIFEMGVLIMDSNVVLMGKASGVSFGAADEHYNKAVDHLHELVTLSKQSADASQELGKSVASRSKVLAASTLVLGSTIALIVGYFMARNISRATRRTAFMLSELENGRLDARLSMTRKDEIGAMAQAMDGFADSLRDDVVDKLERIAQGDLDVAVAVRSSEDRLRGALGRVVNDFRQAVGEVQTVSGALRGQAGLLADTSTTLSQGAQRQESALEEVTRTLGTVSDGLEETARNAQQAKDMSHSARRAALQGDEQMQELTYAMEKINRSGSDISRIIKVIDEIAFQTNLLALNAAVEAARAGQHGKGFAVVAEEVRSLAARSARAASETSSLIEASISSAHNGTKVAQATGGALQDILKAVTQATTIVEEISTSSQQQAVGISQVNNGVDQIAEVTRENTANAALGAEGAEELFRLVGELQESLSHFRLSGQSSTRVEGAELAGRPVAVLEPGGPDEAGPQPKSLPRSW